MQRAGKLGDREAELKQLRMEQDAAEQRRLEKIIQERIAQDRKEREVPTDQSIKQDVGVPQQKRARLVEEYEAAAKAETEAYVAYATSPEKLAYNELRIDVELIMKEQLLPTLNKRNEFDGHYGRGCRHFSECNEMDPLMRKALDSENPIKFVSDYGQVLMQELLLRLKLKSMQEKKEELGKKCQPMVDLVHKKRDEKELASNELWETLE